jgi:hypothetical protein
MVLAGALPAHAAETSNAGVALVPADTVVEDDLYAGAITVIVAGRIEGDLIAAAAERVVIDGEVTGSVTTLAREVVVNGRVGGALRLAAGSATVNGAVDGDIVGTGLALTLSEGSAVGGEVLVWARQLSARGSITGFLRGSVGVLELAGEVGRSVVISVDRLRIVDRLVVGRDLAYRSDRVADGLELAEVGGTVTQRAELPPNIRVRALFLLVRLLAVVFVAVAAVTVVWGWPEATRAAAREVPSWKSWLLGAAVLCSPLIVAVAGLSVAWLGPPEASLPLLVVVIPLVLALLCLALLVSLVAGIPVAAYVGSTLFKRFGVQGATLAGALALGAVWLVPWLGLAVPLLALPLGLGAWLRMDRGQPEAVGTG